MQMVTWEVVPVKGPAREKSLILTLDEVIKWRSNSYFSSNKNNRTLLQDFTLKLGLEDSITSKLTLKKFLNIGPNTCKKIEPRPLKNVPWYFLRKLMTLNGTARSINPEDEEVNEDIQEFIDIDELFEDNVDESNHVNPLDVVCALLNCSDNFLQREITSKMSMCQFAVPLLLPAGDGTHCTFMLWAMRDIVKRWRPQHLAERKGFVEESLVNISMPIFSFVRLGVCHLAKSKILNHLLCHEEQQHDYFTHGNMRGGNVRRVISDGLVEITWYFPAGEDSDLFPDPVAVTNLRGDLQCNRKQFRFLTKVSSTVFVFIDNIDEDSNCLKDIELSHLNYFFIISLPSFNIIKGTFKTFLEDFSHFQNNNYFFTISLKKRLIILKPNTPQDRLIAKKLQLLIRERIISNESASILDEMSQVAEEIGIDVDENSEVCKKTRTLAQEITECIKDVTDYKKHTMKLQGDLWSQLAKNEKEMCRMRRQGNKSGQDYSSELNKANSDLRRQQSQQILPDGIMKFQNALTDLSQSERPYFLKWMKFYLDRISRKKMSQLQVQPPEVKGLGQTISESNLGIEHFLRELGQFYEAECFMVKNGEMNINQKLFDNLPGVAADLLLDGFPLELIDGDASNIPLQWITDVLTDLDNKTGGHCRMRVITVLGVQSTGKSTLLNTMFGLQFPVASGRCTRGAFMTLLKVEKIFQEELGCDFILVIDTEGLKAPELASLDDSSEHDNELATLVVGLSDITIINVSMENTSEMKEILQIVVHAFLRMKQIGKKPNCQFVHQNVSDPSAHEQNLREKKLLLEQLNEMTKLSAEMEGNTNVTKVSDIIEYDIEKHNWYIPGLWHGVPPMASICTGYSDKISEMKMHLLNFLKQKPHSDSCNIKEFIEWIKSLWNAVKHEKFIFSFRNILVADAYNKLCIEYSNLQWTLRKKVHSWMTETENQIKNQLSAKEETEMLMDLEKGIKEFLQVEVQVMKQSLETYFKSEDKYVKLVEQYKEDFMRSLSMLRKEHEYNLNNKCKEIITIQKEINKIRDIQTNYQKKIEEQVEKLLNNFRDKHYTLGDKELESEFETMWNNTFQTFNLSSLEKLNISQLMLDHLRKDMKNKAANVNSKLTKLDSLAKYKTREFIMKIKYLEGTKFTAIKKRFTPEFWNDANAVALTILDRCHRYVTEKITTKVNYNDIFCQHLLDIINKSLAEKNVQPFEFKQYFDQDLKLLVLGKAAPMFQKMHDDFIQNNDPKQCLEQLKSDYLNTFKQLYQEKDDCRIRAQRFCEMCLKPALSRYVYSNLGKDIVDDQLMSEDSKTYSSKTFFQSALLSDLLTEKKIDEYVQYCCQYEIFVKNWIKKHITLMYKKPESLKNLISTNLTAITNKVKHILEQSLLQHTALSLSLDAFFESLKRNLVISQNDMNVVMFQNTTNVHQFLQYVKSLLDDLKEEVKNEINSLNIESVLSRVVVKPHEELFITVFGCGEQCPFCKVPCEAGGTDHKEHFASTHRPQGLVGYRYIETRILFHELCSTDVVCNRTFACQATDWKPHPYKEYQTIYPNWKIQPDPSIEASLYWKYIFKEFNEEFAKEYKAKPADLPEDWSKITLEQALQSLDRH
ncbi:up-regulator of cell proliferation-like [Mixophyes fleayi]|uniref:up-regulator of cell proliferation-like n=1 Tax=Mixophyes fleayi TaxID=3061075 RepID=UPI003F4DB5C3